MQKTSTWMLLVYTVHYQEVIAGVGAALLAAAFFGQYLPVKPSHLLNPVRWFWLLVYIPVFIYMCLKSNIDVALRVLSPGLQIKPGIVRIRTSLTSEIARVFLANSITLTPGTITIDTQRTPNGSRFVVHCISQDSVESILRDGGFVKRIQDCFKTEEK